MADLDKKTTGPSKEEIKYPERKISVDEQKIEFRKETDPDLEKRENLAEEKIVSEELRREIEMMELDEKLKDEAEKKAQKISFLGEKEKIEQLLKITHEKGVASAVQIARRMNDPYLLDIFHDVLAREGYYKNFTK
jgi:hypothetical protein